MTQLVGKSALITGASRGIGAATALHMAAQGAQVALFARSADALEAVRAEIEAPGGRAIAIRGDVAVFGDVEHAVAATVSAFGGLDILVNNAGVIEPIARLAESDPRLWGGIVDVNLKGVYHGLRAAIPAMLEGDGGTIVNLSSGAATSALEGWSHYCATKAAVPSLTACADKEYRAQGVRVVGLSPGTVATEMQTAIRASGVNPVSQLDPSAHIPADWVARTVAYLCGPGGAGYAGGDFSLKNDAGRRAVGLPPIGG